MQIMLIIVNDIEDIIVVHITYIMCMLKLLIDGEYTKLWLLLSLLLSFGSLTPNDENIDKTFNVGLLLSFGLESSFNILVVAVLGCGGKPPFPCSYISQCVTITSLLIRRKHLAHSTQSRWFVPFLLWLSGILTDCGTTRGFPVWSMKTFAIQQTIITLLTTVELII